MPFTRRQFIVAATSVAAYHTLARYGAGAVSSFGGSDELTRLSLAEAAAGIRAGKFTSSDLVEACLARTATYDPKLDAFITVMKASARAQAKELDAEAKSGRWRGPLHGVPVGIKDNIDTAGTRTTGASGVFEDRIPAEDAPVVTRLKAAGAIILGKTNLEEFAMGGGDSSYFGPARNPWNLAHNTGGSSSGSAAAVSAELCYGALGTDTAGSVRIPASFCGTVGLKATYGLVPIRGIMPLTLSLDHCGPLTRTVRDTALLLNCLAGYDKLDITSVEHAKEDYVAALAQPVSNLRLAALPAFFDHTDPEITAAVTAAIDVLAKLTKGVGEGALPSIANAANVGGLGETLAYHEALFKQVPQKYQPKHRARLEATAANPPHATDYIRARWDLELLRRTVDDAFADFDLVVVPTERIQPPELVKMIKNPAVTAEMVANTQPFNVYGLPAITVPCGFGKTGLPIGLTIAGPRFSEGKILALAQAYEQATDWHTRRPPLTPDMAVPSLGLE